MVSDVTAVRVSRAADTSSEGEAVVLELRSTSIADVVQRVVVVISHASDEASSARHDSGSTVLTIS